MLDVRRRLKDIANTIKAIKSVFLSHELPCTVTKGSSWSSAEVTAELVGNVIRFGLSAERKSGSGAGNITNETVCTVKVATSGLIDKVLNIGFTNSGTGPVATFQTTDLSWVDDAHQYFQFTIRLTATERAVTTTSAHFVMPVALNVDGFIA